MNKEGGGKYERTYYWFFKKNKKILFLIGVFFTLNILSSIPLPYLSKVILDDIIIPKKYELIYKILTIFLVIVFLQLVGNYISNYLSIKFIQDYIYSLKRVLYNKIFSSKCKFNNIDIGNAQIILTNDTTIVASYSYGIFWSVALNSVLIIAYTVIMFAINTKLFFINIIMLPFIVYINGFSQLRSEVSETKNHPLCGCEIRVKQLKNHPFLIK